MKRHLSFRFVFLSTSPSPSPAKEGYEYDDDDDCMNYTTPPNMKDWWCTLQIFNIRFSIVFCNFSSLFVALQYPVARISCFVLSGCMNREFFPGWWFENWKLEINKYFSGMFAFAIWGSYVLSKRFQLQGDLEV